MITTIIFTVISIIGIFLQFRHDEIKDDSKKRKIGIYVMVIGIILLVANSIIQSVGSKKLDNQNSNLEKTNKTLIKKLDSCNLSIGFVGKNQTTLEKRYDSLYKKYMKSELLLNDANTKIDQLSKSTQEGFIRNEDAIKRIDKIQVKNERIISITKRREMINILMKGKGTTIEFGTVNTSFEALQYSKELQDIFKEAGWIVSKDEKWLAPSSEYKGLYLFVNKEIEPKNAYIAYQALNIIGYEFKALNDPKFKENQIKVVVGFNE